MVNLNPTTFTTELTTNFAKTNYETQNANELGKNIIDTFTNTLDFLAPMRKMSKKEVKNNQKSWLTKGILNSIKIKTKWLKKFIKSKNNLHYNKYKTYRDKLNSLIRISKRNYYKKYFTEHLQNTKKTWTGINELLGNKRKSLKNNISLCVKNNIVTDQINVANTFNKYFIDVAENLSVNLENPKHSVEYYLDGPNINNFFITPSNAEEILNIINKLDPKKSADIYNIYPKLMLDSKFFLADTLSLLFNRSVEDHCFADDLKYGKVLPTHKGKSKMECSNHRPISLLPLFSKIIERLMYIRLVSFVTKYDILYQLQYGFQSGKSTELAIDTLLSNIITSLENKKKPVCIFLDFAKAFDTVNH